MIHKLQNFRCLLFTACLLALLAAAGVCFAAMMWEKTSASSTAYFRDIAVDNTGVYVVGQGACNIDEWRIEKRDLNAGDLILTFGTNGVIGENYGSFCREDSKGVAVDSTGIYIVGTDNSLGNTQWRIEKRRLNDGALCTAANCGTEFGTGGVVTENYHNTGDDGANDIAIDASGIYIIGWDWPVAESYTQWRIEKRDLVNGNQIWTQPSNPSTDQDSASGVAVDSTGVYVVGSYNTFPTWRIEKRRLDDGNIIWAKNSSSGSAIDVAVDNTGVYVVGRGPFASGPLGKDPWRIEKRDLNTGDLILTFGTNGVVTIDPSIENDFAQGIAIDNTGIYVVGEDSSPGIGDTQWRIEKRDLSSGGAIWNGTRDFTTGYDYARRITIDNSGIYVGGAVGCFGSCDWHIEKWELTSGAPPLPTVNLSAAPPTINSGESSTLTWTTTDATSCNDVEPPDWLAGPVGGDPGGSQIVWPAATETYILSCTGPGGTTQQSTTVTVNPPCTPVWTLTTVDSTGDVGYVTSIATGSDGLPMISYYDLTNADLKVAKCGNAACTSGNTLTTVDSAGVVGGYTSITIGTDGLPVISYYAGTNADLKVAKCGNAACTSGNTLTTVDSTNSVGGYPSITIGTDGLPVISYYDLTNFDLKVAKCGNAACSSGNTLTTVDSGGDVGRTSSIAIGTDGLPVISYLDGNPNWDIKIAKCGNAACTSGNTLTTVDSADSVGSYTSIAIGTDGLPVISYYDSTNAGIKVAKCGNAACTSGNTLTTVDSAGTVDYDTSIAIGTNGLPVISYYDSTNADLKVAKCGNAACTSGNTLTTVDSAGSVGRYASLAIDTDGLPVISYNDLTNADLKVAKEDNCGGGTPLPAITLNAVPSTINGGETSTLTWTSSGAASCSGFSPAGWITEGGGGGACSTTTSPFLNGCQVVQPSSTTIYTIMCQNAIGDPAYQSVMVTVNGGGGGGCGLQMYDGTATVTLTCEDPPVSPLRIYKGTTTYGIGVVDTTDPNASRIRIQTSPGVIKALRKQ